MATIRIIDQFFKKFEVLFNDFFNDKYDEITRKVIIEDIYDLLRNKMIDKMHFCYYDVSFEKITKGYSIHITYNPSNIVDPQSFNIHTEPISLTKGTEKILIFEMSDNFINLNEGKEAMLYELKNTWSYIYDQDIQSGSIEELYNAGGLQVKLGKIKDE